MKKISSEARCTSANGKERRREIREPFGSGIDKYRVAEAIRQNPPRPDEDAFQSIYRNARDPAGTSRHEPTISVYGCVEVRSSAVKYRSPLLRCPGVQVGCEKFHLTFSDRARGVVTMLTRILSGEYAIVPVHQ